MHRFLACLIALVLIVGCDDAGLDVSGPWLTVARISQRPAVDIPTADRQANWTHARRGSCVYATACTVLRSRDRGDLADYIRSHYGGPVDADSFAAAMRGDRIRLRQVVKPDMVFIDRCIWQGRACGAIVDVVNTDDIDGDHFVAVVHADAEVVGFIDPNRVDVVEYVPRKDFAAEFIRCGGWAYTFDY